MELLNELQEKNIIKYGDFVLKNGEKSNYYVNLKELISYPELINKIANQISEKCTHFDFDYICGVPYGAIPLATLISQKLQKPMLLLRKEEKKYGMGNLIEGNYQNGKNVLLIEDVVTTGNSVEDAIRNIKGIGLNVIKTFCVVSRSLNDFKNIHPLIKLSNFKKQIDFKNLLNTKGNLCVALDVTTQKEFFYKLDIIGPNISVLKTHVDMINDFDSSFIEKILIYKKKYGFSIWEDRKFADIGHIFINQLNNGIYKISSWADYVSVHVISGPDILNIDTKCGLIVIVNMSSKNNIMSDHYINDALNVIDKNLNVIGIVSQKKTKSLLPHIVPGININVGSDNMGQTYSTPSDKKWADLYVIGRGIINSENILDMCKKYSNILKK